MFYVEEKKIKRLTINVPPRTLKYTCISVAWPAWILGYNAGAKIIVASYGMNIAIKHCLECKILVESDWFKSIFQILKLAHQLILKRKK